MAVQRTGRPLSPLSMKVLDALEDGEFHDREDIIAAVMYTIPPGEAYRHAVSRATSETYKERKSRDEIIAAGRRRWTIDTINSLIANDRVEQEGGKGRHDTKMIRLTKGVYPVYVLRESDGALSVQHGLPVDMNVTIHVIDAWAPDDDADIDRIKQIEESVPTRLPGRDKVIATCRQLKNRLNVRRAFARLD